MRKFKFCWLMAVGLLFTSSAFADVIDFGGEDFQGEYTGELADSQIDYNGAHCSGEKQGIGNSELQSGFLGGVGATGAI